MDSGDALSKAQAALQKKDYSTATRVLKSALAKDSTRQETYWLLASAYLLQNLPKSAAPIAQAGLRRFPKSTLMQWVTAEVYLQQQRTDEALALYQQVEAANQANLTNQSAEANPNVPVTQLHNRLGQLYAQKGAAALQKNSPKVAVKYFLQAQPYLTPSPELYVSLAYAYLQADETASARNLATEGLRRFPKDDKLLRLQAAASSRQDDSKGVLTAYERLYNQSPNDTEVAMTYAEALLSNHREAEAAQVFNHLMGAYPQKRAVYENILGVYDKWSDLAGKQPVLRRLQSQFPNDYTVWQRIAQTYEARQQWTQSRLVYDSLAQFTNQALEYRLAVAHTWERQDSLAAAALVYTQLATDFPKETGVLARLGWVQESLGYWEQAVKTYERWVALQTDEAAPVVRLAWVQEKQGKSVAALANYEKAILLGTSSPLAFLRKSEAQLTQGNTNEAYQLAEIALRKSLSASKKGQESLLSQLQGSQNVLTTSVDPSQAGQVQMNELVAEQAFTHFTQHFPFAQVAPVQDDLLKQYVGSGKLYYWAGTYQQKQGNATRAVELLTQAVGWQPNLREAQLALGQYYEQAQKTELAILAFERALAINPHESDAYEALIRLYRQQGKLNELCQRWLARYRTQSENTTLKSRLIEALHKAGDEATARQLIEQEP